MDRLAASAAGPAGAAGPEPLTNLLKVFGADPLLWRPWEVGRLTPFQVKVLLAERDKHGQVILDGPLGDPDPVIPLAVELRDHYRRLGLNPDQARRAIDRGESPGG